MHDSSLLSCQRKLASSRNMKFWMPAFAGMTILSMAMPANAAVWKIIPEQSSIEFTATYGKDAIVGSFPKFDGDITFDPKAPEKSHVEINVQMNEIKSSDKDAVTYLPMAEWFASQQFPTSTFTVNDIRAISGNQYEADGVLKMRDKTVPVNLPFTIDIKEGDSADAGKQFATMNGTATINRLDFGVGQGEWASPDVIANPVSLKIRIDAVSQ